MIAWLEYSADQKLKSDGELTKAVSWRDLQARTGLEYSRLSRGYKEIFPQLRFTPEIITSLYASSHLEIPLSVRNTYLGDTMDLLPDVTPATREATADDYGLALKHACVLYKKSIGSPNNSLQSCVAGTIAYFKSMGIRINFSISTLSRLIHLNNDWVSTGDDEADILKVSLPDKIGRSTLLPVEIETHFSGLIRLMINMNAAPSLEVAVSLMNRFIKDAKVCIGNASNTVDKAWGRRFLKRHNLRLYRERPTEALRAKWDKSINSRKMYDIFANIMITNNIGVANPAYNAADPGCLQEPVIDVTPTHVFSADETMTLLDNSHKNGNQKTIGEDGQRSASSSIGVRSSLHITVVACTRGDGGWAAPYVIAASDGFPAEFAYGGGGGPRGYIPIYDQQGQEIRIGAFFLAFGKNCHLHVGTLKPERPPAVYGTSEKGSINAGQLLAWFNRCVVPLLPSTVCAGKKALLLMDGHKSHLSLPFLERLLEMNVCLGLRYPHSSHKTQVASVCAARSAASLFSYNHI
jgi:hypothetical protein